LAVLDLGEWIRSFQDAWNTQDMDAVRSMIHTDACHTPPPGWPEPGPFVGRDAVMTHFEQLRETFRDETIEVMDLTPVGEIFVSRVLWRGTGLGPEAEIEMWQIGGFRDDLLISLEQFWDRDAAFEAAERLSPAAARRTRSRSPDRPA
jgi:hypothetical protein